MKLYPQDETRQMLETLFGFTYRFEAEPIRKAEKFIIKNWWWESTVQPNDKMREMIVNEIARFTEFLQIDNPQKNTIKECRKMKEIRRYDINEDWAHSGIIQAGDYCFINYCARNIGGTIEEQVDGAFDKMEERLALVGLTLENVVQMNCLFKNIWDIPVMEKVIKRRFHGKYPVRKSFQTEFADPGNLLFQVDGIAFSS